MVWPDLKKEPRVQAKRDKASFQDFLKETMSFWVSNTLNQLESHAIVVPTSSTNCIRSRPAPVPEVTIPRKNVDIIPMYEHPGHISSDCDLVVGWIANAPDAVGKINEDLENSDKIFDQGVALASMGSVETSKIVAPLAYNRAKTAS